MPKKKEPQELTTEEAIKKLFPVKAVREAKKRAFPEAPEGEKPQVNDAVDESILED